MIYFVVKKVVIYYCGGSDKCCGEGLAIIFFCVGKIFRYVGKQGRPIAQRSVNDRVRTGCHA